MLTPVEQQGWQDIATAPRDGTTILLTAFEDDGRIFEIHRMQWAHIARNGLFPGRVGMWVSPNGSYTWNDDGRGGGPTHWQPDLDFDAVINDGLKQVPHATPSLSSRERRPGAPVAGAAEFSCQAEAEARGLA